MVSKKRVYRGHCPYENIFEIELKGDCRNCKYFDRCRRRERSRRKRAKHRRERLLALMALVIIATIVIAIIVMAVGAVIRIFKSNSDDKSAITETSSIVTFPKVKESPQISLDIDMIANEQQPTESIPTEENPPTDEDSLITVSYKPEEELLPYISAYQAGEVYYYKLSFEDKVYIAKVVYVEARGEPFEGKVAVAATVLNRFVSNDKRFNTESIYSVVTQRSQFADISGVTMDMLYSVPSCMEAVEAACKGWDPTRVLFANGALFFFNPDGNLTDAARQEREGIETYRIGNHLFHVELNKI